jgi:hypothetical protein
MACHRSRFSFRLPQWVSLRSGLNTRSQPRLSIVVSGWRESQFFRRQRPVNRPLGFCHGLGFGGSSPPYGNACVERDRPFPHVPSNALNDAILDAAIFHVVKHTFDLCPLCLQPSVRAALNPGLSEQLFAHEISPFRKVGSRFGNIVGLWKI